MTAPASVRSGKARRGAWPTGESLPHGLARPMGVTAGACVLVAALTLGSAAQTTVPAAPADEPANVGDAKRAAVGYHDSGRYERDLAGVAARARAWIDERARQVERPAIVFDVDDTALSNWEVILADDFGRVFGGPCEALPEGPCGWVNWDLTGRSPVLRPALDLYRFARSQGVAVFFITGRDEPQRAATERNLSREGFTEYVRLEMVPFDAPRYASAADFKAPRRAAIEAEGYRIIANVGDQPSDLAGGHAERAFLLPNPFYRIP
ncbi:HAD family acid phosphatase [Methylobacterium nigriterrae]|uniref:HAD family acid phosphatase n=1 Tax=Methylobacterium nigriterrae TaxID=3127512 RepID=UPI0030134595